MTPALHQARQLERLRAWREQQALRSLVAAEREQRRAQQAVAARQAELVQRRQARSELLARCASGDAWLLRCLPTSSARLDLLEENIERCEVALAEDEETQQAAGQRCDEARAAWRRALARDQAAGEHVEHVRRESARAIEHRQQRDEALLPLPTLAELRGASA